MSFLYNKYFQMLLRLVIGVIFIYASLDKLFNPADFAIAVKNYQILPLGLVNISAIIIPYVEFIAGTFLVFGLLKKGSSFTISALLVVFLIALIRAKLTGLDINCGCFSIDSNAPKSDISIRIFEDILMLIGSLIIYFFCEPKKEAKNTANTELKTQGEI
ncbi:MAG: DoxX family membrane protein [Ignavibacteriae bacterium]|nr:DoxX family membrane protein [Ignavibacteriota bacterium]MCB9243710.1 DoxX family membrane protein [Ignavibacteriales bacterium]